MKVISDGLADHPLKVDLNFGGTTIRDHILKVDQVLGVGLGLGEKGRVA